MICFLCGKVATGKVSLQSHNLHLGLVTVYIYPAEESLS